MKTIIKITTLAVLAAFAIISCKPEAELSGVDWGAVNAGNDATRNTGVSLHTPLSPTTITPDNLATGTTAKNELTMTFTATADVLKNSDATIEGKLKEFLSFHHFTVATTPNDGYADNLGEEEIDYSFIKRSGNAITLKLNKTFLPADSRVVMKIDGTKYTFAGGNKMDRVNRGITGEAGYDDYYQTIAVSGVSGGDFVPPEGRSWACTLASLPAGSGAGNKSAETNVPIATLTMDGNRVSNEMRTAVFAQLKSGLRIEKFENDQWIDAENASSPFTIEMTYPNIFVILLIRDDLIPYRVAWAGEPVKTAERFGVAQWVKVIGDNTKGTYQDYQMRTVYGPVTNPPWYSTDAINTYRLAAPSPTVVLYSCDSNRQNVVIDVQCTRVTVSAPTPATYPLKDLTNDPQLFKENFKIAYYNTSGDVTVGGTTYTANAASFVNRPDVVYIDIKEYEYFNRATDPVANPGADTIRITLDPAYKMPAGTIADPSIAKYLYIGPKIRYEDGSDKIGVSCFGAVGNWRYGFFQAYAVGTGF